MATIIKIKRSSTTNVPNLGQGELGYSWGAGTYTDAQSATVASYGKMYLGTGTETGGIAANIEVIGGKYFTDMLDHSHGTLTSNSAVIVDSASKINIWNVDNLTLDGNTISSTNTDGDINFDPNGAGEIVIPDDTHLTFGTSKDTKIKYDEATDDRLEVTGADWNFASGVAISISDATTSTTTTTGALVVSGGVGIGGNLNVAGSINVGALGSTDLTLSGDLTVQGGDINVTNVATNINLKDNTASALAIKEGANVYFKIDTTDGSELITLSTSNVIIDNDLQIKGGDLTTNQTTFNLLNSTATTVNAFGAATTLELGASTGTTNINNNLDVDGDVNIDGGDLTVSTATFNLANTNATTVNFAGAATTLELGAATGTTNINNNLDVDGDVNIDGGDLTVSTTTFNLVNTTATTVNFAGAASDLKIGTAATEVDFGNLRIRDTVIYSESAAQTITIDPHPSGGDQAGSVVIRGNLQVSGTTTTVNSTEMTINDPIFTLGDGISEKTVVAAASSGATTLTLDDVTGLNVGDIVSGTSIQNGTTVTNINTGTKVITISLGISAGISASTNTNPVILTFTQGADDNKDRGIQFKYFNNSLKTGFFGYDESGVSEDVTTYYFTYIPDATNTSDVFSGTRGSAYFKTVKLDDGITNGIAFFDAYKRITTTAAAGISDATTSNQILTVNGSGVPVWTTTLDGGTY